MIPNELAQTDKLARRKTRRRRVVDAELVRPALLQSLAMLAPRRMMRNPVMFVTEIGAALTTVVAVQAAIGGGERVGYFAALTAWLWLTVLFANFSEALAEARGRAQADTLRATRRDTPARRRVEGREETVSSRDLDTGDLVVVAAGEVIPGDGEVVEGIASVDESAITGESAAVVREAGGDRSGVTGGTRVLSDEITVRITARPGESFLDRIIALVEGAKRQKSPNEIALTIVLAGFTLAFLTVTATLAPLGRYFGIALDVPTLVALLVCLIPTTIGGLLPAIGLAGMDRALAANVLAKSGKAVELAGDVDTLLLDKTGTITLGNRRATEFLPVGGVGEGELIETAVVASLGDATPEGRSIVALGAERGVRPEEPAGGTVVPFSAELRMSGVDLTGADGGEALRKGAPDAVRAFVAAAGGRVPDDLDGLVERVAKAGATPVVVARGARTLGVVALADVLKPGIRDRFLRLRAMGLRVVMVTGDNPLTAKAIAGEAGVDDFIAEARPEDKLAYIRAEQEQGAAGGDDGRRHQRRPGAGPGRPRGGDERRHPGGQGGRQHDRPRQRPDQADRGDRDRQAAADDPRRADHLLDRQRRGQVLRHRAGDVPRRDALPRAAQPDASCHPGLGDPLCGDLQRPGHPAA